MAKSRFPGKPGYRFNRQDIYLTSDMSNLLGDSSNVTVRAFKKSLITFKSLFGESDEDEEFEGFLLDDVILGYDRYKLSTESVQPLHDTDNVNKTAAERAPINSVSIEAAKNKYKNNEVHSTVHQKHVVKPNTRICFPSIMRQPLKIKFNRFKESKSKHCFFAPRKFKSFLGNVSGSPPADTIGVVDDDSKLTTDAGIAKTALAGVSKGAHYSYKYILPDAMADKGKADSLARFLKQKSKELEKMNRSKHSIQRLPLKHKKIQKKSFVLPNQSRFSRKIIPNKRLVDELNSSAVASSIPSSKPLGVVTSLSDKYRSVGRPPKKHLSSPVESHVKRKHMPMFKNVISRNESRFKKPKPKMGLFDQPLVVKGKRQWKPSLKLRLKLNSGKYNELFLENDEEEDEVDENSSVANECKPDEMVRKPFTKKQHIFLKTKKFGKLKYHSKNRLKKLRSLLSRRDRKKTNVDTLQDDENMISDTSDYLLDNHSQNDTFLSSPQNKILKSKWDRVNELKPLNLSVSCLSCGCDLPESSCMDSHYFFYQNQPTCRNCQKFWQRALKYTQNGSAPVCSGSHNCSVSKLHSDYCQSCHMERFVLYYTVTAWKDKDTSFAEEMKQRKAIVSQRYKELMDRGELNTTVCELQQNWLVAAMAWSNNWDTLSEEEKKTHPSDQRVCAVCYNVFHYRSRYSSSFQYKPICHMCYVFYDEYPLTIDSKLPLCQRQRTCRTSFFEPDRCKPC